MKQNTPLQYSSPANSRTTLPPDLHSNPTGSARFIPYLLAILTFLALAPLLTADFTNWDDHNTIVDNPWLNPPGWRHFPEFWSPRRPVYMDIYIPLTYTIWSAVARVAYVPIEDPEIRTHLNPWMFHGTNMLVHLISVLVVFRILKLLVKRPWAAAAGAALYAVHPVQVEPVAWVSGLKDVLCGCLGMIAIWQFLEFSTAQSATPELETGDLSPKAWLHYALATLALIGAMFSKPSGVMIPAVTLVVAWVHTPRRPRPRIWMALAFWFLLAIPFAFEGRHAQPGAFLGYVTPLKDRPWIALDSLAFYLYKLFVPLHLTIIYDRHPATVLRNHWQYFTWIVPAAVVIAVCVGRKRYPWLRSAVGVYWIAVLPVLGLVPFDFQDFSTVADHYLYVAMLGPAIAVAFLLRDERRVRIKALAALLILLLAGRSFAQCFAWRNSVTLYSHAMAINPASCGPYNNLGLAYEDQHDYGMAMATFENGLHHVPHCVQLETNLAQLLGNNGQLDQAEALFEDAAARVRKGSPQDKLIADGLAEVRRARARDTTRPADQKTTMSSDAHLTRATEPIQSQ